MTFAFKDECHGCNDLSVVQSVCVRGASSSSTGRTAEAPLCAFNEFNLTNRQLLALASGVCLLDEGSVRSTLVPLPCSSLMSADLRCRDTIQGSAFNTKINEKFATFTRSMPIATMSGRGGDVSSRRRRQLRVHAAATHQQDRVG